MDRLELAQRKYQRIAPGAWELDEEKSDKIEAWLREYVVPLVSDLQRNPAFRRYVKFGVERLAAETDVPERQQVVAVSDALVACASEVAKLGDRDEFRDLMRDRDLLQELNERKYGASSLQEEAEEPKAEEDTPCIAEKMAEQPWFDLVMSLDFPYLEDHLFVVSEDSWFYEAFTRFRPNIPVLGDGITRMLFARIDFWVHHLKGVWNQMLVRIMQTSDDPHGEYEPFFMTMIHLDKCVENLKATCLSGDDGRMRDACCTLMQVYIAYHPRPELPWLDLREDIYQAKSGMLGLEFRRLFELIEYDQVDARTIQESGRRQASIVVMDAIQQVLAAIEDVAELYRRELSLEEIINEARSQYRLVVVTRPRMVFFDGEKLNVDWNRKNRPWELLRFLAAQGERLDCVDRYHISGSPTPHALSNLKSRLCKILMESDDLPNVPATQLAALIEHADGAMRLDLAPDEIKVVDLEDSGADEWTIDPTGFETSSRETRSI
ncbi:MAG: hypothetical protein O3A00_05990 [Planctomycetota bacterium]|nr:hypothetical protein [Planctomycetota bacterium]